MQSRHLLLVGIFLLAGCSGLVPSMAYAIEQVRVNGRVSLAHKNYAIEGAEVRVQTSPNETLSSYTRADGGFSLTLNAGQHLIEVDYLGLAPHSYKVDVKAKSGQYFHLRIEVDEDLAEVLLLGQTATTNKALNKQRSVERITQVLSNDALGQFPDANVAESLARLPGIAITRDQGEGRYARVHGLSEELNSISFNGAKLTSPSDTSRAIALDIVPIDLVSALVLSKTLTPDQDANAIGGNIDIQTISGFDRDGLFYNFNLENWYAKQGTTHSPKISASFSNIFDAFGAKRNFAIAASLAYQDRDYDSSNVEVDGNWDFDSNPLALEEVELRHYKVKRERLAVGVNLDYKPSDELLLYARLLHSRRDDSESRNALEAEFDSPLLPGQSGTANLTRELKQRVEVQQISSYSIGVKQQGDVWLLDTRLDYSQAKEKQPLYIDGAVFSYSSAVNGLSYDSRKKPYFSGNSALYDSANFMLDEVEISASNAEDSGLNFSFDLSRDLKVLSAKGRLQFGAKLSQRTKRSDKQTELFEDFAAAQQSLSLYATTEVDYSLGRLGQAINADLIYQNLALAGSSAINFETSLAEDFKTQEDIAAAYLMYGWDVKAWSFLSGFRYEATSLDSQAFEIDINTNSSSPRRDKNDYQNLLPGFHLKYQWDNQQQLKAAVTQVVVRPDFEQLSASRVIDSSDNSAFLGNPNLDPWFSTNVDLAYEGYFDLASSISLHAFFKDIKDFVYFTQLENRQGFSTLNTFVNGQHAHLYGLELGFSHGFTRLPQPWNGLLVSSNVSVTDSRADYNGRRLTLTKQSERIANFSLGYESTLFSSRLSLNYQSGYLDEVGLEADQDVYAQAQTQLDLTLRYWLSKQVQVYLHGINLTDQALYLYNRNSDYNRQYETYGQTWVLGVKFGSF